MIIAAASLALTVFLAILFFNSRRRLDRLSLFARKISEGKKIPSLHEMSEPFRSIVKNIETLAATLEERVQAAREEKKRLSAILESMAEGVAVVDTEQKVLLVNAALEKYFGLRRDAVEGRYFWETFRDIDINQMIEKGLRDCAMDRKEHSAPLSRSVFEIQVSPVFSAGEFLGVVTVFRDVTMLKEFERLRTEFVANVSHELKTPLTSILGFVETLKEGGMDDPENRGKFLQIIEDQSKKLHVLIEDLLLLSKIESAAKPPRLEEVDIEKMFRKMEETFLPLLKENNIQFHVVTSPKAHTVQAEPASLERALSNLIDNALKYNRPNGRVTLQSSKENGNTMLEVRDTGIGIAAADLPRVFERFYRVDKSRSRESPPGRPAGGGAGLGLSIAKHIVERHGGRIEVRSTPGQGSTFSIILPS